MLNLFLPLLLALQTSPSPQSAATDIFQALLKTEDQARAVSYIVKRDYIDDAGRTHKGRSTVLLQASPFHARAEHYAEDGSLVDMTVSDEKTTHGTSSGQYDQGPTFVSNGGMVVLNDAGIDIAMTWNVLLNPDFLRKAIASSRAVLIWQDEIEDDECNVVFYAHDERADFYWFSTKTGLPRAVLRMNTLSGHAKMSPLSIITDIRFNPEIPAQAFAFEPMSAGPAPPQSKPASAPAPFSRPSLVGRAVPPLEVRDPQFKAYTLPDLTVMPTLITFWAPWCGPCISELAALAKLRPRFNTRFQVLAIAVQDKRQTILKFIGEHPNYPLRFFTDPDLQDEYSRLATFFGVASSSGAAAIPVSLFTDAHGRIVAQWDGFESKEELDHRLTQLLRQSSGSN